VLCDPCGRHFRKTKTLPKRKRRSLTQHFAGGTDTAAAAADRLIATIVVRVAGEMRGGGDHGCAVVASSKLSVQCT
jgi:hypothetical protein